MTDEFHKKIELILEKYEHTFKADVEAATGTINISGNSTLDVTGKVILTKQPAILNITGSDATINVSDTTRFDADTTATFIFDASGISTWNTRIFDVSRGGTLHIVADAYAGTGLFTLVDADTYIGSLSDLPTCQRSCPLT